MACIRGGGAGRVTTGRRVTAAAAATDRAATAAMTGTGPRAAAGRVPPRSFMGLLRWGVGKTRAHLPGTTEGAACYARRPPPGPPPRIRAWRRHPGLARLSRAATRPAPAVNPGMARLDPGGQ